MSALNITPKINKGFTLIELLIVIAIIGILAIAVLAALNPVEQINKSRDSGSLADSEQLKNALDRFYASNETYPWQLNPNGPQDVNWTDATALTDGVDNVLDKLSLDTGELQSSFVTKLRGANYNDLFVERGAGSTATTYVCFLPRSDEFSDKADEKCASSVPGYPSTACPGTPNNFYCLP